MMIRQIKQETLRVVAIAMICSTLASLWKFQHFRRPIYNSVKHLWWSFYCKNSTPVSVFTESSIADARLGSNYAYAFWGLFEDYFIRLLKSGTLLLYIKHAITHLMIKSFDLLNIIPLSRIKTFVNSNLL